MGTITKAVLLSICLTHSIYALEWVSYEDALQIQKQTKKPIMIDVVRTLCHYCNDMNDNVFENEAMATWLEERFIPVKINLDFNSMPIDQEVSFTPTFFFLDTQGKIIKKIPGSWNIQDFKDLTRNIK
ncbi:thioredoxin family protein [Sulfurimonas sp.]|uniref:thioredoxin family protein n=1 Tax=Sulfurimonas sp. TaxID=2022749 RepID=UPI003D1237E7